MDFESTHNLAYASVSELLDLYRKRQVSPVEMTELFIDRIGKLDGKLNAFLELNFSQAREQALRAEANILRGDSERILEGIPITVKDLELTEGLRTTSGSLIYKDRIPVEDSIVVERIRASGAIIIGKSNTPEFGLLGETRNRLGDHCRNPWDISKTSGGSSGGAAAALISGMCTIATGSDGGGSIRIPASFTGTYGIKPSQGRVPRYPVLNPPISNQTSQSGPMARSVYDCALLLQVMSGYDPRDVSSLRADVPDFSSFADAVNPKSISELKIGWTPDFGYAKVDPEVLKICETAVKSFSDIGCDVGNSTFSIEDPFEHWMVLFSTMSLASNSEHWPGRSEDMTDYANDIYDFGSSLSAADFSRAIANVNSIRQALDNQFEKFDILISPTMAVPPYECGNPPLTIEGSELDGSWGCLPFTYPINSAGNPAASIPAGMTSEGLPVGLHIIGKYGDEETVIAASAAFEAVNPWSHLRPEIS